MSIKGRFTVIKGIDDVPFSEVGTNKIIRYYNRGPAGLQLKVGSSYYDLKPGDCYDHLGNVLGAKVPPNEAWDASVLEWEILSTV